MTSRKMLPEVGDSLPDDQRHEMMLRKLSKTEANALCPGCRRYLYPVGRETHTGLCWLCTFPRRV